jgi:transposase-like protein
MDAETNTIIAGEYGVSEFSIPQLYTFLQPLQRRGLAPISCTIDGNPHVYKVLKELWPDIIIQRCLVHIQRQGLSWCRRFPKRPDAKHLRNLFKQVCYIDSLHQQQQFIVQLSKWERRFGSDIELQPGKGKVFSDLKRARSMLVNAVPNMFYYLADANIPKTTNALEGYYSRLKERYRRHRGLTRDKLHTYFNWYFYLKPM